MSEKIQKEINENISQGLKFFKSDAEKALAFLNAAQQGVEELYRTDQYPQVSICRGLLLCQAGEKKADEITEMLDHGLRWDFARKYS